MVSIDDLVTGSYLLTDVQIQDLIPALLLGIRSTSDPGRHLALYGVLDRWIRGRPPLDQQEIRISLSPDLKEILFWGLTHVWSALRQISSKIIANITMCITTEDLSVMVTELHGIILSDQIWQQRHGAMSALLSIIRSYHSLEISDIQLYPIFITDHIIDIIFHTIQDEQVSIRHCAVKSYSAYVNRTGPGPTSLLVFDRALDILEHGHRYSVFCIEGVLELIIEIVSHLGYRQLLDLWPKYYSLLERYLAHQASTVRQMCSKVYLGLISVHDISDHDVFHQCLFISYLIHSLTRKSLQIKELDPIDNLTSSSTSCQYDTYYTSNSNVPPPTGNQDDVIVDIPSWRLAEGILMSQELIVTYLYTRLMGTSRRDRHRSSLASAYPVKKNDSGACLHNEIRLRSQSISEIQTRSEQSRFISMLMSMESDKSLIWTPFDFTEIPKRSCSQCNQAVFTLHPKIARLSTMISYWISTAIECGFSQQWELRRMSDQIVSGLFDFSESISSRILTESIRGPHPTWLDRARACLCARYVLIKDAINHMPDSSHFLKWANRPHPDRITILSLATLWDLIAKSNAEADRRMQFVLVATVQAIVQVPAPVRDWFVCSIREAISEVARHCPRSQIEQFATVVLKMIQSTSATYRPDLLRSLVEIDVGQVRCEIADRIANLCIEVIGDPESDPNAPLDILDHVSAHHNPGWINDLMSAISRRHGRDYICEDHEQHYFPLLVTPSTGHIKKLSLDSDSSQSSSRTTASLVNNGDSDWDEDEHDLVDGSQLDLEHRMLNLVQRLRSGGPAVGPGAQLLMGLKARGSGDASQVL